MRTAFGVVGANYGDEGKGASVDRIVRDVGAGGVVVVRSNGGAQAGHTVVTPDGRRHVFHHIGSGAHAGAATHLSRFFVHHPMTFMAERDGLAREGACVEVSADPRGYVTTPWDMMVNQVLEVSRGAARHGSCGYGFGETVGRNEETGFRLVLADLAGPGLRGRLEAIRREWLPARLSALGLVPDGETSDAIASDSVMEAFAEDCRAFLGRVALVPDAAACAGRTVVFEGAQGLMLDQRSPDFPHVTRSNTGVENMAAFAREAGIGRIEVVYATRCYLTRHGSGSMPDERDLAGMFRIVDETNVPNPWQQAIRQGLLDPDLLAAAVRRDVRKARGVDVGVHLAVSCLDQRVGSGVAFMEAGVPRTLPVSSFLDLLHRRVGASTVSAAHGAARNDPILATVHVEDARAA